MNKKFNQILTKNVVFLKEDGKMFKKMLLLVCCAVVVTACAKKQVVKPTASLPPTVSQRENQANKGTGTEEPSVRFDDWRSISEVKTVYFDYDSKTMLPDSMNILKTNAEYLKNTPDVDIMVSGHCDERGTTEYNLALGQKRAAAVRDYYVKLGIPAGRVATISFGEEQPIDPGHDEQAWSKNRRAETKVRNKKALGKLDTSNQREGHLD
jgi:peptidoglycan-associated lipoprotein